MSSLSFLYLFELSRSAVEGSEVIGDWMGSLYSVNGRRWDLFLFLDHDGRYERTVRMEPDYERRDVGRWEYDGAVRTLRLVSDMPDDSDRMSAGWSVLSVSTCEDSNLLLILQEICLASRNLPILLSRVHCNGRGYGTNWEQRLAERGVAPDCGGIA